MAMGLKIDIRDIVISNVAFGPKELAAIQEAISADYANFQILRDAVDTLRGREGRTPADNVRLGVCQYLLGRYGDAIATLQNSDNGALSHFYRSKAHLAREEYEAALEANQAARIAGYNSDEVTLAEAEILRYLGNAQAALTALDSLSGAIEQTADYLYQRSATVAALGGNPREVVALLERAVEADPDHAGALFGLALEHDRRGNDITALRMYEKAASQFPAHVGTLLNLGILYEDMENYDRARACYQRLLASMPNEPRARLFFKDADASRNMYYDEEARRAMDRLSQMLSIPVADFELSVRSRNCLEKMGIMTLGDLTRTTEQELLASKNFGETSLIEIRDMLSTKGLELGQFVEDQHEDEPAYDPMVLSEDERALLDRPIADLNLSVRARKCMVRLSLTTIGDLVRRTGDDLLECKNFGVTSLNEVREKLTIQGLKLRGD
ncbi:MAG: tetratricopeptide repeat protein [Pirellulales bacterium]|nr:tetratricopeptide repeat protein [Pirellulales bacterium]